MPVEVETVRSVEVPTRLVHGVGAISRLGETLRELGVTRPLLVTDPGVVAAGLAERALEHLDDAVVFDEVRPNPDIALVDAGARMYAETGPARKPPTATLRFQIPKARPRSDLMNHCARIIEQAA